MNIITPINAGIRKAIRNWKLLPNTAARRFGKIPPNPRQVSEKTYKSAAPCSGSFLYAITSKPSDNASIQEIDIIDIISITVITSWGTKYTDAKTQVITSIIDISIK